MESSQYEPPVRRSLSDEELAVRVNEATASHNGMEAVMDLLVAQEALRAQEDAEIEAWVEQMEADGSPAALQALAKFQGRDFIPQTDQFQYVQPEEEQPELQPEPIVEPEVEAPAEPFSWFTKTDDEAPEQPEVVIEEVVEVVEIFEEEPQATEVELVDLEPVGTETEDEFEKLLHAASAEEELTALEDQDQSTKDTAPSNLVVPSDEHRNRKPISQLLVWLGASAVVVPLLFTLTLVGLGLSAQTIAVDLVVGYLVSGAIIATAGLAGKRSGLSTATISRAVFGVWGNSFPLTFVTISRLVITAIVLAVFVMFADGVSPRLLPFDTVLAEVGVIKLTAGFVFGLVVLALVLIFSMLRGKTSRISLLVLSIASFAALVISMFGFLQKPLAFSAPGQIGIASKESAAAIALIVAVQLVLWIELAPNLSKAIPMKPRGIKVFLSILGSLLLVPLVVAFVTLLWVGSAITDVVNVSELGPVPALVASLPSWAAVLLLVAVATSLVYVAVLNLKTLSLNLIALVRIRSRLLSTLLAAFLVLLLSLWFTQQPADRTIEYLSNMFVLAAALSAGWLGMFVSDVALRRIAYHELSLNRSYGFYGRFNILSLVLWVATVALAVLLVPVNLAGFSFMGYLSSNVGLDQSLGSQAIGVCLVIFSGALLTLIARIPQIRKQEKEVLAVESRREQLNDIFIGSE